MSDEAATSDPLQSAPSAAAMTAGASAAEVALEVQQTGSDEGDLTASDGSGINLAEFAPLPPDRGGGEAAGMDLLLDVVLQVSVELGRTRMSIGEVLALRSGSVIELDKLAGEPADILVNGTLIARGEVVVVDEKFGVRVLEVVSRARRLASIS